jgi:hypothetical protein
MIQFESIGQMPRIPMPFQALFLWKGGRNAIEEPMRKIIRATVIMALPAMAFAAEPAGKQPKKAADTKSQTDARSQTKPCAEYGAGFVRLEGSSTCVKVSGYVRFQAGRSR